jgi:hypothetical protein
VSSTRYLSSSKGLRMSSPLGGLKRAARAAIT